VTAVPPPLPLLDRTRSPENLDPAAIIADDTQVCKETWLITITWACGRRPAARGPVPNVTPLGTSLDTLLAIPFDREDVAA
jgi:hypothetical protein